MDKESKQKILGAFVVGFALVAGAYTLATIDGPKYTQPAAVSQPKAPPRSAITVVDSDNNGIEDWRESFVTTEPVIISETVSAASYQEPDTVTGQTGVQFLQSVLESRIYTQNPDADKQIIDSTITQLENKTSGILYDTNDINIIADWTDADIRNYANVMGSSLTDNSVVDVENELLVLQDILVRGKKERIAELTKISNYYKTITAEALNTPVPAIFAKEHLDLINTYYALSLDVDAMGQSLEDPIIALMRMRKYEDDALGLSLALQNMYASLLPYSDLFSDTDPAVVFALFAPQQRI